MADNDRFIIQKITTNKKCFFREQDGIELHPRTRCLIDPQSYEYVFDSDCKKCEEGKTRAEYEDMIAENIYKQILNEKLKYSTCGMPDFVAENFKIKAKNYAKAVVDRLFGEGEC